MPGLLLWIGQRLLRTGRKIDYMEAVAVGNGQLERRAALLQASSSFFTIGSGGSIGREGPLVQLAATVASKIGQWTQAPVPRLRLLVACGAAAGIATAYNAPIAGALFVAEVVLGSIAMESFGPLIVSSVVADATSRHFLGYGPVYQVPHSISAPPGSWRCMRLLGVLLGHGAPPFLALLDRARLAFRRLHWNPHRHPGARRADRRPDLGVGAERLGQRLQRRQRHAGRARSRSSCWAGAGRQAGQHRRHPSDRARPAAS